MESAVEKLRREKRGLRNANQVLIERVGELEIECGSLKKDLALSEQKNHFYREQLEIQELSHAKSFQAGATLGKRHRAIQCVLTAFAVAGIFFC